MNADSGISRAQRRRGLLALATLALGWAFVMQELGWAQSSHYALVRAFAGGTAKIDDYHWETRDKAYYEGHFYSVKAPGLAFLVAPFHELADAAGAKDASRSAARTADTHGAGRWVRGGRPQGNYGNDPRRAERVRRTIEEETPFVWGLGLLGVVVPGLVMLLLVRSLAERVEPGYGTAAALTLGAGTLVMPFGTLFFSHLLAALLGFAAFAVLWREREGPPRLPVVAAAGALAGLAVTTEYPLAMVGAVLGIYAISRGNVVRRGAAYTAGVVAGVLPLALYNLWAFGSLFHSSYEGAVAIQGRTGHDVLGLNDDGFFGIGAPSFDAALKLLFAGRGLLVLSPVLVLALLSIVLLYRRGHRAEALTIGGLSAAFLVYNAGYYLPFGGGSPGPRFLIPILPFLAVPLALAYRRYPVTALGLAVSSAVLMIAGTVTLPLIGDSDIGVWTHLIDVGIFQHTLVSVLGGDNSWPAVAPVLVAVAVAVALTVKATPRAGLAGDWARAAAAVAGWACLAVLLPKLVDDRSENAGTTEGIVLIAAAAAVSLLAIALAALLAERPWERLVSERGAERGTAS